MVNKVLRAEDSADIPSRVAAWFDGAALKFSCSNKKDVRMRPASFLGGMGAIGFAGNQSSSLLKCFSDCAPATREKV